MRGKIELLEQKGKRLLVVDDHPVFLDGLTLILEMSDMGVEIDSINAVSECLRNTASLTKYDLILVDLNMPSPDGFALLDAIRIQGLKIPTAVISGSENFNDVQKAITKGAQGFIFKSICGRELLAAIKILLDGKVYVPEKFSEKLDFLVDGNSVETALTERQYQVLKMINDGLTNSEIAQVLNISLSAVKNHIEKLFKVYGVNNRTSCLKVARENGVRL